MGPVEHEAEPKKPTGFKYSDGSILVAFSNGYRRHVAKPLSKRERAKIKRQAKKAPERKRVVGITVPNDVRVGGFFA